MGGEKKILIANDPFFFVLLYPYSPPTRNQLRLLPDPRRGGVTHLIRQKHDEVMF